MENDRNEFAPQSIEKKWQQKWIAKHVFAASDSPKKKYYQLETFPYPSAAGLHVGHPKGYVAEDIHARYMRMKGYDVLYTMGWDAFGLPTENYAIKVNKSPKDVAIENIKNYKRQVQMFGLSYDWDREINTSDPSYYRWTQLLFIQLFKKGLAYRKKAKVNWCPKDHTVLANEQVVNGECERCHAKVEQKEMEQWFLKITDYADRLVQDLEGLDWPESTLKRQRYWIGRSEGAVIKFQIPNSKFQIPVFTTRPDTLYGATYMVLAPEHELIQNIKSQISNFKEVEKYIQAALSKTELERQEEAGDKTGIELKGVKAINPATKEEISIWVADYVLGSYGTGAIMAVPAHDERDNAFARKFNLPIVQVIKGPAKEGDLVFEGTMINSDSFDGLAHEEAKWKITKHVGGESKVQYRIRDWSVSRQRYWGVPIPMVHCAKCGIVPIPDDQLPVVLPDDVDFRPKGMPPLASSKAFMNVTCPECGGKAQRDPETLDTFVDSSWYFFRYTDPQNTKTFADKKKIQSWMPIDLYVIGAEHSVLHLLYARFISKFLYDEGYFKHKEPFLKLRHLGLIQGSDGQKMSKSRGNVVNPDELVEKYGADAFRLYEMFMGPFEDGQPWDPQGVVGMYRFLKRIWTYVLKLQGSVSDQETPLPAKKILHATIKKVGSDIETLQFNTAIAAMMTLLNELQQAPLSHSDTEKFLKILHPFAPHMAQELWSRFGHESYLDFEPWPPYDATLLVKNSFIVGVQINGKRRAELEVTDDMDDDAVREAALALPIVKKYIPDGTSIKKFIYVSQKIISIVV